MSSKNTSPLLSVRSQNGDLHPGPLLLGEDFGFRTLDRRVVQRRGLTPVDDLDGTVSWSRWCVFADQLRSYASQALAFSANHHPMGGSRPMAFLGCARGHRIDSETRCCMQQHTERLMSAWILSLEPERRRTDGYHRGIKPGRSPEFWATLKLLAASVVPRRNVPPFSKVSKQ